MVTRGARRGLFSHDAVITERSFAYKRARLRGQGSVKVPVPVDLIIKSTAPGEDGVGGIDGSQKDVAEKAKVEKDAW